MSLVSKWFFGRMGQLYTAALSGTAQPQIALPPPTLASPAECR
jgi:hypothetical protein